MPAIQTFGLIASAVALVNAATTVVLPPTLPPYSKPLNKDLVGLSIEMDHWPDWAGSAVGKPNAFVTQVLNNLGSLTGVPTHIRVGADSEDNGYIQPGLLYANATFPNSTATTPYPEATHIGIGSQFYTLSANFPKGTSFTWGVNLRALNATETVAQVHQLYDTFYGSTKLLLSNVTLKIIEFGNEPDHYTSLYPTWDIFQYLDKVSAIYSTITSQIDLSGDAKPKIQMGAYAGGATNFIWDVVNSLGTGVLSQSYSKFISTFSYHTYFGVYTAGLVLPTGSLMNRALIRQNTTRYAEFGQAATAAGQQFVIGECNSYANHGVPGISDAAEAAIWLVDFALQSAAIGVERMNFHEGIGYAYNLIQPIPVNGTNPTPIPKVQPAYYGAIMTNEAIGTHPNTKIAEIPSNSTAIASYGIWEDSKLARVVVINSNVFLPTVNATRSIEPVSLRGYGGGPATIRRFYTPSTNATSGMTWGGQSFNTPSGAPSGNWTEDWLSGPVVNVSASEVALICFK